MPQKVAARYDLMRITFKGIVQGVGFRPAVYRTATALGLQGKVWNSGSDVIVEVNNGDAFLSAFLFNVPPLAVIESISGSDPPLDNTGGFFIVSSEDGCKEVSVPSDMALCDNCLNDLRIGRRKGYAFTSCTDCGPRFTLLSKLPYDRSSTSMKEFVPCSKCQAEYDDPNDRRFHHQTICCPKCGPSYSLVDSQGNRISGDPVKVFSDILSSGKIGVIKGWGGMHICCTLENLQKMRKWYGREQKPFAVMVRDLISAKRYSDPTEAECVHLTSPQRPIVLVKKKRSDLTELASPGLDNIGLFLPYTGIQHLLFDLMDDDALVMTSANLPKEPMILDDELVKRLNADAYLLHDQPIINRADDSVIRLFREKPVFIRRSRGHVPSFIPVDLKGSAVAVGAQENLTGSVATNGRIHMTQHIGDGEGFGVIDYLDEAVRSDMRLLGCTPQAIAMDLHPNYSNRVFAKDLASEYGSDLIEVQHHWAHSAALITENKVDEAVVLALDGTGHGDDGQAWGGEVLLAGLHSYERVAHMEYIPLLGSERALHDLRRLKFAIDLMNGVENTSFDEKESDILSKMMNTSVKCSSMGRLMDALSYTLGVCSIRTYDGEPAMKLEPLLTRGRLISGFETERKGNIVQTSDLFSRIKDQDPADIAYSVVYNIMKELVGSAIECADDNGIENIGITGGVSYNSAVCNMFSDIASGSGHELIFHESVPNGDGGISVGQVAIALKMIQ
jgi:[NiFe] hydrogenase maturation protein HypF